MAEALKNVLDFIRQDSVQALLSFIPHVGSIVSVIGSAFSYVHADRRFPWNGNDHEEIIQWFERLSMKVDGIENKLETTIKWEAVKLQYTKAVRVIQLGMQHTLDMDKSTDLYERRIYESRLNELGSNQSLSLALDALIDGLTGKGVFETAILDECYSKTKGHLPKVKKLAYQLLHLVYGGMAVMYFYETITRGERAAEQLQERYSDKIAPIPEKVQTVLVKCRDEFKTNMKNDLQEILNSDKKNEDAVNDLGKLVKEKYDWLENCSIICNTSVHLEWWCTGKHVMSIGQSRRERLGIICYRKIKQTKCSDERKEKVVDILKQVRRETNRFCHTSTTLCALLSSKIQKEVGLDVSACVVMRPKASLGWIPGYFTVLHVNCNSTVATLEEDDACATNACRDFPTADGARGISDRFRYFLVLLE